MTLVSYHYWEDRNQCETFSNIIAIDQALCVRVQMITHFALFQELVLIKFIAAILVWNEEQN